MNEQTTSQLSVLQQSALILLRTLIGWHFLYEAYYKLTSPAWSPSGGPLTPWTSAGYLKGASGPLAPIFQHLVSPNRVIWVDRTVKVALLFIGLSLLLGVFTRIGSWMALFFLSLFYILYVPTHGVPQPNAEGTYLIVNKTLIEAAAVIVLLAFNTGSIAGLDLLWTKRRRDKPNISSARLSEESEAEPANAFSTKNS